MTLALVSAALMVALRWRLAHIYSDNAAVVALAAALLLVTAGYQLADALQTLCIFVLRCYRVTVMPFFIYCALLWGVGLGGSYRLAYHGIGPWPAMQSPLAFWGLSAIALAMTGLFFLGLLWRAVGRPMPLDRPASR